MKLNLVQFSHLASLRVADAVKEYDNKTRREWKWKPHIIAPLIRSSTLYALERRKLARWFPNSDKDGNLSFGGRMKITPTGKTFLWNAANL